MASWDDDDFDAEAGFAKASTGDKWEGEDEEEDVKDDWAASDEDEDANKNGSGESTPREGTGAAFQVKKKKNTLEQALKRKAEKRKEKQEATKKVTLTPEEELEEKLRRQKLVEDADLELAKEAFGMDDDRSIDAMNPTTEEEFTEFGKLLKEKLSKLESSDYYPMLLEDVFQSCCVCLDSDQVKKLGSSLTAIANEKSKAQKALKGKKGKKKANLAGSGKSAKKDEFDDFTYDGNEFDDFM